MKTTLVTQLRLFRSALLAALFALLFASAPMAPASASVCTLADHIRSANTNTAVGFCPAGTSHDIITIAEDITLTEPLPPITGTITIEGGGHTISGDQQFRIFNVQGGNLTIKNLTLREGRADHGAAVRLQAGSLFVFDSSFVGNRTEKSAGAIYANGGTLDISNSRFEDNCAQLAIYRSRRSLNQNERSVDADGCVQIIYAPSFTKGSFSNWDPQTDVDGGAIRLLNGAQATIERTTFSNNKATDGGAISISSGDARLVVKGSSFLGNQASERGGAFGALWSGGGSTSISNSSFVKNRSGFSGGGAISASKIRLDISNTTFSDNKSDGVGGALHVDLESEVTVTHATFSENRARYEGAAISRDDGKLYLRNSIVVSPGTNGDCVGGLNQNIGNLSPDRTCGLPLGDDVMLGELTGSPAYHPPLDHSPAVDAAAAEYCLGTDQLGTPRPQSGGCDIGAIESTAAKPAEIEAQPFCPLPDQIIAANTDRPYRACPAGNGADTIYLIRDITLSDNLQPITSDITIEGNGYTISGNRKFRIFDVDGGMLTVKNLTMTKGNSGAGGGAIRLQNGGRALVSDSRFVNNDAENGGAIFIPWLSPNSWMTIDNSSFVNNRASLGGGGALYAGAGRISVSNSSFVNNSAGHNSGAIGMINAVRADVNNSTFIGNGPSALSAENDATVTLTHVTIQDLGRPAVILPKYGHDPVRLNLRNSIIAGRGFDPEDCDNLKQNIGNLIEDGSCSPMLSGDPMLAEATESSAYLDLRAGSPAIQAADARFCPDTDQIGRARAIVGRCDIGAVESMPVRQALSDCSVTTTHGLNLREDPNGKIVRTILNEETLAPLARTDGWFNVEYQGVSGWISADYLVTQGDCR